MFQITTTFENDFDMLSNAFGMLVKACISVVGYDCIYTWGICIGKKTADWGRSVGGWVRHAGRCVAGMRRMQGEWALNLHQYLREINGLYCRGNIAENIDSVKNKRYR